MATITNKIIRQALLDSATFYPETVPDGTPRALVLALGTFKLRCLPCQSAVMSLADKYRRPENRRFTGEHVPYSYTRSSARGPLRRRGNLAELGTLA